ncbi:hypothetical protein AKJ44_01915 [candidate division MSBL1 archaeon SCGC-AAA261F17]|uniref:Addiction module toxin RelE n=1 Tax=candidate division MSBL1 archaeon SCGC-AAA261F17 TaxID=1698274 RepID=A0A133V628_9EURY|nr:hypothetical protein AKJ44_01915 [candidate division MSBL1 archaeon SCGC-AAA261F17]
MLGKDINSSIQDPVCMTYEVETTESFDKEFKKKHKDKRDYLKSIISKLEKYPDKYGKPLRGRLHGT